MKRKKNTRLSLAKETITQLSIQEKSSVQGGIEFLSVFGKKCNSTKCETADLVCDLGDTVSHLTLFL